MERFGRSGSDYRRGGLFALHHAAGTYLVGRSQGGSCLVQQGEIRAWELQVFRLRACVKAENEGLGREDSKGTGGQAGEVNRFPSP